MPRDQEDFISEDEEEDGRRADEIDLAALEAEEEKERRRHRHPTFGEQLEDAQGGIKVHSHADDGTDDEEVAAADDEAAARGYALRTSVKLKASK